MKMLLTHYQKNLCEIFGAALAVADPYQAVLNTAMLAGNSLQAGGNSYCLDAFERILVIGAGKATARMALAMEEMLGARIAAGLIVVKGGHTAKLSFIEQIEASHPIPNQAGEEGTRRILDMARAADDKTLVICLLSGGASALLVAPASGVTLRDKQETTALLLNAGAPISDLNAVRKHLSAVKGGRLAQAAYPAQVVTLILSDVIGDRLDVIASGPTAPDGTTFADAWLIIKKYGLQEKIPPHVADYLQRGMAGTAPETLKEADPSMLLTRNVIVGSIKQALAAAEATAQRIGYAAKTRTSELQGEAREAARMLAHSAIAAQAGLSPDERVCLLFGGETTVTVKGAGKGGRNQELALAFALEIDGRASIYFLSAGTDGSDGPNDAAGAMVDGNLAARARQLGIDPARYLRDNDSYGFFQRYDTLVGESSHFKTGPTGTNVMDVQIILLEPAEGAKLKVEKV